MRFLSSLPIGLPILLALTTAEAPARVLERGNGPEPSTLDVHRCQEIACSNVLRDLYEGLVTQDAQGRIVAGLAERYQRSADGKLWTFHLRAAARWSDGSAITADQVVASFQRAFAASTAAPLAPLLYAIRGAAELQAGQIPPSDLGVRALDAQTIEIELERPIDLLPRLTLPIAFPLRADLAAAHGSQHTQPERLVGNGAYRLSEWRPQSMITLQRNPHFHSPAPIEQVRFHVTEDAASELKRYAAGDLHITETVPPGRMDRLRARFGEQLRVSPYLGVFFLGLNIERAPLDAPLLREALSLSIDRELLVRAVTGMGELPAYTLVPPGVREYEGALPKWAQWSTEQRLVRARIAYAEAGYSATRPARLSMRFNTSTVHRRVALAVAAMWREQLGVITELRNEEWKVFVQNRRQRRVTEVFRGGWIADFDDASSFLDLFVGDSPLNWSGYRDPRYDALLQSAQHSADTAVRASLHAEAEARLLEAHAIVPLYVYTSKHLVHPQLRGFEPNPLDRHPSRYLSFVE
jgi:oligopeptide transport system substrate-binding protein